MAVTGRTSLVWLVQGLLSAGCFCFQGMRLGLSELHLRNKKLVKINVESSRTLFGDKSCVYNFFSLSI